MKHWPIDAFVNDDDGAKWALLAPPPIPSPPDADFVYLQVAVQVDEASNKWLIRGVITTGCFTEWWPE